MKRDYDGIEFINKLEKIWQEQENKKPKEARRKFKARILADDLGVDETQISKWQRGKQYPKVETLMNICKALGITLDYLLGYSDNNDNDIDKLDLLDIVEDLFIYGAFNQNAIEIKDNRDDR